MLKEFWYTFYSLGLETTCQPDAAAVHVTYGQQQPDTQQGTHPSTRMACQDTPILQQILGHAKPRLLLSGTLTEQWNGHMMWQLRKIIWPKCNDAVPNRKGWSLELRVISKPNPKTVSVKFRLNCADAVQWCDAIILELILLHSTILQLTQLGTNPIVPQLWCNLI